MLDTISFDCPYCDEILDTLLDESDAGAHYCEDCPGCRQPVRFAVNHDPIAQKLWVKVSRHDE